MPLTNNAEKIRVSVGSSHGERRHRSIQQLVPAELVGFPKSQSWANKNEVQNSPFSVEFFAPWEDVLRTPSSI
ncbi:hypothetical protein I7I48_03047 [Histoplasma ohiense]|nr:hypothetical protein I7I48_03047 [Histoplasma ohiense (nom. inval.)]